MQSPMRFVSLMAPGNNSPNCWSSKSLLILRPRMYGLPMFDWQNSRSGIFAAQIHQSDRITSHRVWLSFKITAKPNHKLLIYMQEVLLSRQCVPFDQTEKPQPNIFQRTKSLMEKCPTLQVPRRARWWFRINNQTKTLTTIDATLPLVTSALAWGILLLRSELAHCGFWQSRWRIWDIFRTGVGGTIDQFDRAQLTDFAHTIYPFGSNGESIRCFPRWRVINSVGPVDAFHGRARSTTRTRREALIYLIHEIDGYSKFGLGRWQRFSWRSDSSIWMR